MAEEPRREFIETEVGAIHALVAGEGPPLLLLHGYPQSHVMWFRIAPALAERFTVVMPDLRGYGDSAKPPGDPRHETYSKRAMARDQVTVMAALGFRSEEHTSELQSLMRISYAVFGLKKKKQHY